MTPAASDRVGALVHLGVPGTEVSSHKQGLLRQIKPVARPSVRLARNDAGTNHPIARVEDPGRRPSAVARAARRPGPSAGTRPRLSRRRRTVEGGGLAVS